MSHCEKCPGIPADSPSKGQHEFPRVSGEALEVTPAWATCRTHPHERLHETHAAEPSQHSAP